MYSIEIRRPVLIEGKTPWQFACSWYSANEVKHLIARKLSCPDRDSDFPADVSSDAFAVWLTEQYQLAMTKGIEIGIQANALSIADELDKAKERFEKIGEMAKRMMHCHNVERRDVHGL